jgi:hypothetical protein
MHTLGLQDRPIEIGEVQAFTAVVAMAHITAGPHQLGAIEAAQLVEFGKQLITSKHGSSKQRQ